MAKTRILIAVAAIIAIALTLCVRHTVKAQKAGDTAVAELAPAKDARLAEAEIRDALSKPCKFRFMQKPLWEVAALISDTYGINVTVDRRGLENEGYLEDEPVELRVAHISLRSALSMMLEPLSLTWIIRNETLIITSRSEAEGYLVTRVYEVSDLVPSADGIDPAKLPMIYSKFEPTTEFDQLRNVLMYTIEPESWDEVGGAGAVKGIQFGNKYALVIAQTEEVHDQVATLLESLRKISARATSEKKNDAADHAAIDASPESYVQVYPISIYARATDKELEDLVRVSIGEDNWSDGTVVCGVASAIVVKHNGQVQRRVYELLTGVGAMEPVYVPGFPPGVDFGLIPVVGARDAELPAH